MENYWTDNHRERLSSAQTFDDLTDIALDILKEMSKSDKPIVQLCGPISTGGAGNVKDNLERFDKAIHIAYKKGMQVFSQTAFEKSIEQLSNKYPMTDGYCLPILDIFYKKIFSSGYIKIALFLPDWESSKGARWERNLVSGLGLEIREFPIEWFEEYK